MLFLVLSLFFTEPRPLDMPKAEAFLVKEDGRYRLEDRYDALDLWQSHAVLGRWEDQDGRVFTLSRLDVEPPPEGVDRSQTRVEYMRSCEPLGRKGNHFRSIGLLYDGALSDEPRPPRQLPRGFKDVAFWQHPTNFSAIVCAFLPERSQCRYLATWELVPGDDYPERMHAFETRFLDAFLRKEGFPTSIVEDFSSHENRTPHRERRHRAVPDERELLRVDAHHNVTNYAGWHFLDAPEFTVLSDMPNDGGFLTALTNDLHRMRRRYAEVLPTRIDGTNVLCVARIFRDREEYLDVVDEDMRWTAAYWSPSRRELVAYLPAGGEAALLQTIRHEAFHQYLSYAASMIAVSPWLNEGYAQYFENENNLEWGNEFDLTPERIDQFAEMLPGILGMDYVQFYAGTDLERRLKYKLAWSVACFLEKGAPDVRFKPFATVKADYFASLFDGHDMRRATSAAFRNADTLKLFVSEWKKFWKERGQ